MTTLGVDRVAAVERLCDLIVPGSSAVGPAVYIDAVLGRMPPEARDYALHAFDLLAAAPNLAEHELTAEFALVRALAIEAYFSDFVAPGSDAPGAYAEIDFNSPLARRVRKDWSFLGVA
ncbi:MAG: hypothetical protein ACXVRS_11880 [Gaiellaceae bacterium]